MAARKIRDEHDARACLEAAARGSLTPTEWAHDHGVDARSLNAWRMNLNQRARAQDSGPLRLLELIPGAPLATSLHAPPAKSPSLVVRRDDWAVEIREGVDEDLLVTVLSAVASC